MADNHHTEHYLHFKYCGSQGTQHIVVVHVNSDIPQ